MCDLNVYSYAAGASSGGFTHFRGDRRLDNRLTVDSQLSAARGSLVTEGYAYTTSSSESPAASDSITE